MLSHFATGGSEGAEDAPLGAPLLMEQLRGCSTDAGSRAKVELMEDLDALIQLFLFRSRH